MCRLVALVTSVALGGMIVASAWSEEPSTGMASRYSDAMGRARGIRIAKMASEWKGKRVTLETREGRRVSGTMVTVRQGEFVLENEPGPQPHAVTSVPVGDVAAVTLHAGLADLLLGGVVGVASGAVAMGVMGLANDGGRTAPVIGGIGGFLVGSLLGIRLLHRDTVVALDWTPEPGSSSPW